MKSKISVNCTWVLKWQCIVNCYII